MATTTAVELLLLVPGAARVAQGWQRERLVQGLTSAAEDVDVVRVEDSDAPSHGIRVKVTKGTNDRLIDVAEAYWNDLLPSLAQAGAREKFLRGTSLIAYWGLSVGVWRGASQRIYLTLGLVTSAVALVAWYFGTVALFLDAVRNSETAPALFRDIATSLGQVLDLAGGWGVWVVATAIMGLIPVNLLVDIMDFSKRFLSDERVGDSGLGLRVQVRKRVREQLKAALAAGNYRKLTLVGHSFGCLVALDLLADLPLPPGFEVRLVTVGSSIELFSRKAGWLTDEIEKCAKRPELQAWVDVVSDNDFFASGTPKPRGSHKFERRSVPVRGTFIDAVMSRTHGMYFDADATVQAVLG